MTILEQPSDYEFAGNFPDILVDSSIEISFTLKLSGSSSLLLDEVYSPDSNEQITIELREFFENYLQCHVPSLEDSTYDQVQGYAEFVATIDATEITFTVVSGGGKNLPAIIGDLFHTWQPSNKRINKSDVEFLTFYAKESASVYVKYTYQDNTTDQQEIATIDADQLLTVNVSPSFINDSLIDELVRMEVWVSEESSPLNKLSNTQIFTIIDEVIKHEDLFLYANSLGGIDSIRFAGILERVEEFQIDSALFNREILEYYSDSDRVWNKSTGSFKSRHEMLWARDFFASIEKYWYKNAQLIRIRTSGKLPSSKFELNSYNFSFIESELDVYQDYRDIFGPPQPPAAPILQSATILSETENQIIWIDNSDDETGFEIQRSENGVDGWQTVGEVGEDIEQFVDDLSE